MQQNLGNLGEHRQAECSLKQLLFEQLVKKTQQEHNDEDSQHYEGDVAD